MDKNNIINILFLLGLLGYLIYIIYQFFKKDNKDGGNRNLLLLLLLFIIGNFMVFRKYKASKKEKENIKGTIDSLRTRIRSAELYLKYSEDSLAYKNYKESMSNLGENDTKSFYTENSKFIYWTPVNDEPLKIIIDLEELRIEENNKAQWNNVILILEDDNNGVLDLDNSLLKYSSGEVSSLKIRSFSLPIEVTKMPLYYYPKKEKEYLFNLTIRDKKTGIERSWGKIISNGKKIEVNKSWVD